jgi:CxxC-x17-CxxC domain-containing protein
MNYNAGYSDRILTCRDCGQDFTFTAGEQEFYASRNLTNDPSRCPSCRAARRGMQSSGGSRAPRASSGEHYETVCADCGRTTSVPFVPREDRPVYCSDCFQNHRPARSNDSRGYSSSYGGGRGNSGRGGNSGGRGGRDRDYDRW